MGYQKQGSYYVYIVTNKRNNVLYIGVTNNLERRMFEHQTAVEQCFTARYKVRKLVYFEEYDRIVDAICREKQLKGMSRGKKIKLIDEHNSAWEDLCR